MRIIHARDFLETTVAGVLDFDRSRRLLRQIAVSNESLGYDLLLDLRQADGQGLSYSDVYALVKVLDEHPDAFSGKLALLDTYRPGFEKMQFFEASAEVRGFQVRAFLDFETALHWLLGEPTALDASAPEG